MDGPVRKILVYIDGTEQSITAAQYAICLSKATGAELTALYVVNVRALNDLVKAKIFIETEQAEYQRDLHADAERYLNHVKNLARGKGVVIETESKSGTPYMEIKNTIIERKIDLLIIGELSRIRSRRDEFFNEAERAMRNAPCSVLIVKDEDRVWDIFEGLV
ncbi:MAG: universal stress protein [Spirochaetales bacterium]|nr:universal stress protein [Spirochaetales bacterium]